MGHVTFGSLALGSSVVAENLFSGVVSSAGSAAVASKSDHTHGTPLPRHPQTGFPNVDFSGGALSLGRRSGEYSPALLATEDVTTYERLFVTCPVGVSGWGRATLDLWGVNDGSALIKFYNDLDVNGAYGNTAAASKPFGFALEGYLGFLSIADTPAVAPAGQARIYYQSSAGKLQVSQNGGAYTGIGEAAVGHGAFGTFLITDPSGSNALRWTTASEIYFNATDSIHIGGASALWVYQGNIAMGGTVTGGYQLTVTGKTNLVGNVDVTGSVSVLSGSTGLGIAVALAPLHVVTPSSGTAGPTAIFALNNCGLPCAQPTWTEGVRLVNTNTNGRVGMALVVAPSNVFSSVPDVYVGTPDSGGTGASNSLIVAFKAAGTLTEFVRITGTGNVGIGTVLPRAKLSFGTMYGSPAVYLYDAGAAQNYGMGIQANELQVFIPTAAHMSFNSGGDLQTSGTNEIMRLTGTGTLRLEVGGNVRVNPDAASYPYDYLRLSDSVYGNLGLRISRYDTISAEVYRYAAVYASYQGIWMVGPAKTNGTGQPICEMLGFADGTASAHLFNDLDVNGAYGNTAAASKAFELDVDGPVKSNGLTLVSARSKKTNIRDDDRSSLAVVRRLRRRRYSWLGSEEDHSGFVADEVAAAHPSLAATDDQGVPTGWKLGEMVTLLVGGMQEQSAQIEALTAELAKR